MKLTKPQLKFLRTVATERLDINEIAFRVGQRPSTVSVIRNALLERGLIEDWVEYTEPVRITAAGLRASKT